jgi:folate-binding protein YgfZ
MEKALNSTTQTQSELAAVGTLSASNHNFIFESANADWRRMRLAGADGVDLLNRLCCSELNLDAMRVAQNGVFTDERGRYLAVFVVSKIATEELLLACHTADAPKLQEHIAKYTIIEDAKLNDCSDEWEQLHIVADLTEASVSKLAEMGCIVSDSPFKTDLPLQNVIFEKKAQAQVRAVLDKHQFTISDGEKFEQIRIWHGLPAAAHELTDAVNPLEAGLRHLISFTKGCYIGQEVIARLDTYDKVQRQITAFDAPVLLEQGAPLESTDGVCGWVSSCVALNQNHFIGLGFTKKKFFQHSTGAPLKSGTHELRERVLV